MSLRWLVGKTQTLTFQLQLEQPSTMKFPKSIVAAAITSATAATSATSATSSFSSCGFVSIRGYTQPPLSRNTPSHPHQTFASASFTSSSLCASKQERRGTRKRRSAATTTTSTTPTSTTPPPFATSYHAPVMWKECVDALLQCERAKDRTNQQGNDGAESTSNSNTNHLPLVFVDATLGGGGHSEAILQQLKPGDVLLGCDVDPTALSTASKRLKKYMRGGEDEMDGKASTLPLFVPVQANFCDLASVLPFIKHPMTQLPLFANDDDNNDTTTPTTTPPTTPTTPTTVGVDGILMDLGVSSHQIDTPERGFAFMKDGPLDMRMSAGKVLPDDDDNNEESPAFFPVHTESGAPVPPARGMGITAADVCNEFDEADIRRLLKVYGDEPRAKKIARSIVEHRPMTTTGELIEAVAQVTPERAKTKRMGRMASLARVFQSLRIVVNQEDTVLEKALIDMSPSIVRPGGRLVVLAYHSMEDRAAKRAIRDGTIKATGKVRDERDMYGNYIGIPRPWKSVGKRTKASDQEVELNIRARSATLRVGERQDTSSITTRK